jgi:hypothetical protein
MRRNRVIEAAVGVIRWCWRFPMPNAQCGKGSGVGTGARGKSIKHVRLNEEWVKAGD